tara:strand:- start:5148 stop:5408 length:261 start_codon:yes stop_codon:yes gene_type:complete
LRLGIFEDKYTTDPPLTGVPANAVGKKVNNTTTPKMKALTIFISLSFINIVLSQKFSIQYKYSFFKNPLVYVETSFQTFYKEFLNI